MLGGISVGLGFMIGLGFTIVILGVSSMISEDKGTKVALLKTQWTLIAVQVMVLIAMFVGGR